MKGYDATNPALVRPTSFEIHGSYRKRQKGCEENWLLAVLSG